MEHMEDHKLIQHEIHDEMKNSYIDYAMSVIVGRALPDVRDGMKPVHRRILFGMDQLGTTPDKPYKKSARIVGEVMGKYHPHGDSSIYDAMVRMAQDFSMRYPLVDGHGNFGSIDGDSAAAQRYTEARMSPFSMEMLRDIDKDTVDFTPNFDGEEKEPVVLPSRYPNLLVNGSNGIAVGMATNIPPHNLGEVIDATVHMIDEPECTVDDLMNYVKGPDFPTGAQILGRAGIREAYRTGMGKIRVRAVTEIEESRRGRYQIVVSEIPYGVNKARMIEKMAELVKDKRIEGISDIRDESSREGMRIVIELKKDVNPQIILNKLYKHTSLQENFGCIMIALVDGEPKLLNLRDILEEYLKFQKEVITRRTKFDLKKAEARAHILEGYIIALDNIDEIIRIIRSSYNAAQQKLMERFGLSEIQAKAILDMRLARLQGLEREKIENEYQEIRERIAYFKKILADEHELMNVIKEELLAVKEKWGYERRTKLVADVGEIEDEDLVAEENVAITLTHLGYIKRVPMDNYKAQHRGGKGITGLTTRENDFVKDLIMTSTHDHLMFFTSLGKVYKLKAYQIPEASRTAKGTPVVNFLNISQDERVSSVIPVGQPEEGETSYLTQITKLGRIKRTLLSEFRSNRANGLIAINLKDGDSLVDVKQTGGSDELIVVTKFGKSIRFREEDVRAMGRDTSGVRAILLEEGDEVVSMSIVDPEKSLLTVTENGFGKRTPLEEYKLQIRGGKGIMTVDRLKIDRTGNVVGAEIVDEDDEIMLINSEGIIIRVKAADISELKRSAQGVKIMRVEEDEHIVSMARVIPEEDEEEEGAEASDSPADPEE